MITERSKMLYSEQWHNIMQETLQHRVGHGQLQINNNTNKNMLPITLLIWTCFFLLTFTFYCDMLLV